MRFAKDHDLIQALAAQCTNQAAMPFCHGDAGVIGRSRIPIALTRAVKTGCRFRKLYSSVSMV